MKSGLIIINGYANYDSTKNQVKRLSEEFFALNINVDVKKTIEITYFIDGESIHVDLPKYDFKTGTRVAGRKLKINADQPIIIECIHALNDMMTRSIPPAATISSRCWRENMSQYLPQASRMTCTSSTARMTC